MKKYTMPSLQDILTEKDIEKYSYMIQGYTYHAHEKFNNNILFPIMPYTHQTLDECDRFLANIGEIDRIIPKNITGIDLMHKKILFTPSEFDNNVDKMYCRTVKFKRQLFKAKVMFYKKYQEVSSFLQWEPIGLQPNYYKQGILFTRFKNTTTVDTYVCSIATIKQKYSLYNVSLEHIDTWNYSMGNRYDTKKLEYIKKLSFIDAMPYCILVSWQKPLPSKQTVLPIIKQSLQNFLEKI